MDKPIPEAVRATLAALDRDALDAANQRAAWTDQDAARAANEKSFKARKAVLHSLTAAQQQGQAVACAHCGGPRDSAMHSFSDRYLEAQGMYHEFVPNTAPPPSAPVGVDGTWLWGKLMDWCREQRIAPATQDKLFAIAGEAHRLKALAQQPAAVDEVVRAAVLAE